MVQKSCVGGCVTHFRYIRGIELKLSGITPGVQGYPVVKFGPARSQKKFRTFLVVRPNFFPVSYGSKSWELRFSISGRQLLKWRSYGTFCKMSSLPPMIWPFLGLQRWDWAFWKSHQYDYSLVMKVGPQGHFERIEMGNNPSKQVKTHHYRCN